MLESILNADLALNLFEESNDALVIFDPVDWRILDVNPMAQRITRRRRRELIGQLITDVIEETRPGAMREFLNAAEKTGMFHAREGFAFAREEDDELIPLNVSVSRIHVEPHPLGLLVARDISKRVRAEQMLRNLQRELERANGEAMLSEMVAGIVHEIRQPIHAIGNYAEACRGAAGDAGNVVVMSGRIKEESYRCSRIVDELRSLFTQAEPECELLDINHLIRQMESLIKLETEQSTARVVLRLADAPTQTVASPSQIQHLLINLVRNAVEAVKESGASGGRIEISTEVDPSGFMVLSVSDTGCGVSPEIADEMFHPFRTSRKTGLGMGLAISRRIAEAHGGSIRLRETSKNGSCFEVRLPGALSSAAT